MLEIGAQAPDFTSTDQHGRELALTDLRGKWVVLYFYPRDDTPGCTTQACEFTATLPEFEARGAVVLGMSPDGAESHRRFADKHALGVRLLADPQHQVMERYGAWGTRKLYGRLREGAIRSTVLIDPQGRIAHHWRAVRAAGHAGHVRTKLDALQNGR